MDIITEKELIEQLNRLDNPVDRFLIAGVFYGLFGTSVADSSMLEIKKNDVDFKNKTIHLKNDLKIKMNQNLEKITREAINQEIYVKMGSFDNGLSSADYVFNPNSEFIIRVKPTTVNNNGINQMSLDGFKSRFKSINAFLGTDFKIASLKNSGSYNIMKKSKNKWTIAGADIFLRENGLGLAIRSIMALVKLINEEK